MFSEYSSFSQDAAGSEKHASYSSAVEEFFSVSPSSRVRFFAAFGDFVLAEIQRKPCLYTRPSFGIYLRPEHTNLRFGAQLCVFRVALFQYIISLTVQPKDS